MKDVNSLTQELFALVDFVFGHGADDDDSSDSAIVKHNIAAEIDELGLRNSNSPSPRCLRELQDYVSALFNKLPMDNTEKRTVTNKIKRIFAK